ncbi:MAG: hypothetical protein DIU77_007190 [Thermocrispum agreste]|jgi:hypothetical protein|uniref:Uncharacterized protein n=1 Tax=Thermocrispum agreste TaxID=37925 RepID=A0ABD6FF66_9PSEU
MRFARPVTALVDAAGLGEPAASRCSSPDGQPRAEAEETATGHALPWLPQPDIALPWLP